MELPQNQQSKLSGTFEYLKVQEVAELFDISQQTVRQWIKDGFVQALQLPGKRGRYRIPRSEVIRLVNEYSVVPENSVNNINAENEQTPPLFEEGDV